MLIIGIVLDHTMLILSARMTDDLVDLWALIISFIAIIIGQYLMLKAILALRDQLKWITSMQQLYSRGRKKVNSCKIKIRKIASIKDAIANAAGR